MPTLTDIANATPMRTINIDHGIMGTDQTVQQMKKVILASLGVQAVRLMAEELVAQVPARDKEGEVGAVYAFVRDQVRYTRDPKGLEYVQTPSHLLKMIEERGQAYGDCDDKTVLGLALLKNLGYEVAIRVAGYRTQGVYTHVYGLVKLGHQWVPFDATPSQKELGWEHPPVTTKDYPIGAYGYDLSDIVMGDIDLGSIATLVVGITLAGMVTSYLKRG